MFLLLIGKRFSTANSSFQNKMTGHKIKKQNKILAWGDFSPHTFLCNSHSEWAIGYIVRSICCCVRDGINSLSIDTRTSWWNHDRRDVPRVVSCSWSIPYHKHWCWSGRYGFRDGLNRTSVKYWWGGILIRRCKDIFLMDEITAWDSHSTGPF